MKVCIDARYVYPKIDGIGRYLINLIDNISLLSLNDSKIHFYVLEIDEFAHSSLLRNFDNRKNLTFIKIPIKPLSVRNNFLYFYLRHLQLDIFHYPQFDLPFFLPKNVKVITTIHDLNPQKFPEFFQTTLGRLKKYYSIFINSFTLKKSDIIIAISKSTKNEIINFYGERFKNKIKVIYEGVKKVENSNIETELLNQIKEKYSLKKYFLYVGNNRPHKNLKRMLHAFSEIKNKFPDLKFVLVGRQLKNYEKTEKIISELLIRDRVIILELDDIHLRALYKGAAALVFCSLSEGFGLPILEAMSMGVPVITSNISSMKEIAEGYALLVNPESIEDIKNAMVSIIKDQILKKNLSLKGISRANEFSWEKCAYETLKVYLDALSI